jgi:hypothetical protein
LNPSNDPFFPEGLPRSGVPATTVGERRRNAYEADSIKQHAPCSAFSMVRTKRMLNRTGQWIG